MSSKPETTFYAAVIKKLPKPPPLVMKNHNPFYPGVPDQWIAGSRRQLWIEYKVHPNTLSSHQIAWISRMIMLKLPIWVAIKRSETEYELYENCLPGKHVEPTSHFGSVGALAAYIAEFTGAGVSNEQLNAIWADIKRGYADCRETEPPEQDAVPVVQPPSDPL